MTGRKSIGKVTAEEKDAIEALYKRKTALSELFKTLAAVDITTPQSKALYDKLVQDMGETATHFTTWWNDMRDKYGWQDTAGMRWEINFATCEIFLIGDHIHEEH